MTPLRGIGILLLYFGAGLIILQIKDPSQFSTIFKDRMLFP